MPDADWSTVALSLATLIQGIATGDPTALRTLADTIETADGSNDRQPPNLANEPE